MAMETINLRELRDTRHLKALLRAGETVELRERNTVLGRIVPVGREAPPLPDFRARAKALFGDRLLPGADLLIEEREKERY